MQPFSSRAKKTVAEHDAAQLIGFMNQVPLSKKLKVLSRMGRIAGFRTNSKLEADEKQKRLAARLLESADNDPKHTSDNDWTTFFELWVEWGCATFGEATRPLLSSYDDGEL